MAHDGPHSKPWFCIALRSNGRIKVGNFVRMACISCCGLTIENATMRVREAAKRKSITFRLHFAEPSLTPRSPGSAQIFYLLRWTAHRGWLAINGFV